MRTKRRIERIGMGIFASAVCCIHHLYVSVLRFISYGKTRAGAIPSTEFHSRVISPPTVIRTWTSQVKSHLYKKVNRPLSTSVWVTYITYKYILRTRSHSTSVKIAQWLELWICNRETHVRIHAIFLPRSFNKLIHTRAKNYIRNERRPPDFIQWRDRKSTGYPEEKFQGYHSVKSQNQSQDNHRHFTRLIPRPKPFLRP